MKKVGSCYYVHKSNKEELITVMSEDEIKKLYQAEQFIYSHNVKYEVIKYDFKSKRISFIDSPDWNISNEPIVGDSNIYSILENCWIKSIKGRKNNQQIYHHKWMFVNDDYNGFDIQKSKERSELLFSIPSFNTKEVKSRIGYKDYWVNWCKENGIKYD